MNAFVPASLQPATLLPAPSHTPAWSLANLAGRLAELSGHLEGAQLTAAFGLVLEAQRGGDRSAWVTLVDSAFFPPDAVEGGVDLDALPVVRVQDVRAAGRAADHLVRSGGFGLVVVDLSSHRADARASSRETLPVPLLTRLLGLARQQEVAVLLLTRKPHETPSLHSLISLRVEARWRRQDVTEEGCYELCIRALKDKRSGPGWMHLETCRGPAGLR